MKTFIYLFLVVLPSLISATVTTIEPTKDAFVNPAGSHCQNYGSDTDLRVAYFNSLIHLESYLAFDTSSIAGTVTSAILTLRKSSTFNSDNPVGNTHLAFNTTSSWNETTITRSSVGSGGCPALPTKGGQVASGTVDSNGDLTLNLTTAIVDARSYNGGVLSILIEVTTTPTGQYSIWFSREYATSASRPKLAVTY